MKLNLLFVVLICLFQFSAFAQSKVIYKSNSAVIQPDVAGPSIISNALTAQEKEKMARQKREGISTEPVFIGTPNGVHTVKPTTTTTATVPTIQRADAKFARISKTKGSLSPKKAKTPAQEIADIEREIDRVSNSDDPEKVIRIQKMEKLLEKKKLEKFSKDQSN